MKENYPIYFKMESFSFHLLDVTLKYPKTVVSSVWLDRITNRSLDVME